MRVEPHLPGQSIYITLELDEQVVIRYPIGADVKHYQMTAGAKQAKDGTWESVMQEEIFYWRPCPACIDEPCIDHVQL